MLTTKADPRNVIVKIFLMTVDPNIGIQMNQKERTKTFLMIYNCVHSLHKNIQRFKV